MPAKEAPSYSSARVQRATRINGIEATRLQQRLQFLEQAKLHQCRLTNQDIRLISMSIDYIQASSGHSPEAWRPEPKIEEEVEPEEQGPCFLYGERIWSRKKRRIQRPMSAVERSGRTTADLDDTLSESLASPRPQSSPAKNRPMSAAAGLCRLRIGGDDEHDISGVSEMDGASEKRSNGSSTPRGRVEPHQDWEDDTTDITKKILKAQARAQSGTHRSVYQSPEDVMNASASRSVRGLMRKIRVSATPVTVEPDGHPASQYDIDQSPRRPIHAENNLGRRATLGEILNQRRPTMSAGAWRSHLSQTSATPMSISAHRRLVMDARKEQNNSRTAYVNEKVKDFIKNTPRAPSGRSGRRAKSAMR